VSTTTAPSLPLGVARRADSAATPAAAGLSRREATLRSAATTCLAGIALVQAIMLPSLFTQGGQFAVLAGAAMAVCLGLGLALAAAPAGSGGHLWRLVAATAVVVIAGWLGPRLFAIPGLTHHKGHWAAAPAAACAALALAALVLAVVAVPPTRVSIRGLATAMAVMAALAPGIGALFVALGPGLSGGETSLAAGVHANAHAHGGLDEKQIVFQSLPGGRGGHYVYKATPAPHQTAFGIALIILAAIVFTYGAVGYLRRRTVAGESAGAAGLEQVTA
jgi:hypothetical protein